MMIVFVINTDKYKMYNVIANQFIGGSSVSTNNNYSGSNYLTLNFTPLENRDSSFTYIELNTPHVSTSKNMVNAKAYIDSFVKEGILPILDNKSSIYDKFNITIYIAYSALVGGHTLTELTTSRGEQSGSTLKCTQIEEKEEFGRKFFELTFEINCKLYCLNYYTERRDDIFYYGPLKGIFKTKVYL
jgi:hypothetical protein